MSAESHGREKEMHIQLRSRAAIGPLQFLAREVGRHPTETLTIGHRRTEVRQRRCEAIYFTMTSGDQNAS